MLKFKIGNILKNKKSVWELIEEIPDTPEQKKIDREIVSIEKKYEHKKIKKMNNDKKTVSFSKIKKDNNGKNSKYYSKNYSRNIETYGQNAGKIYNELNNLGPSNQSKIMKDTKMSLNDFYTAIGWLARENKIYKDTKFYKLGNTNLTDEIGDNAGKIWRLLNSQGQANISSIYKSTDLKFKDVYSAIGWLSRENKIRLVYENKQVFYKLT